MKQFDVKFPLSPLHLFVIIVAIVYLAEVLEMFVMGEVHSDNTHFFAILVASIMTAPILWWLIKKHTSGALDEIKEKEERFRSIIKSAIDSVILVDSNGNIISWNKSSERDFLYTEEEVLGKPLIIIIPERYRDAHIKGLHRVTSTDESKVIGKIVEMYGLRKDGSEFPMELSLSSWKTEKGTFFGVIIRNITERKNSEVEYKTILRTAMDSFYLVDVRGRILDVNDSYCSLIGYSRDELLNMGVKDVEAEETEAQHIQRIMKVGWGRFETRHKCKNGRIIDIEASINYSEIGGGKFFVFMRDITERKKSEEMSRENERLVYASKAKNDFLSNMSHELRTHLNAVIGFSELLKMKTLGNLTEKQEDYVDNIRYGGKHLLNVISDILDLSKIDAGKMELVIENISVPETLNQTIVMVEEMAKKSTVSLKKELAPELEFIEADKQRFIQIISNLLSNAIKFNRKRGIVTVTTNREGDMAKFSVSDTGIGIKEEDKNKLFKDFEQLDSGISKKYGGTGLGLAITKKLVELYGGLGR